MMNQINRVWEAVNKSLAQIWQPVADSIGIPYIYDGTYNYIIDKRLYEQSKHFDENLWDGLVARIEKSIGSIALISRNGGYDDDDAWIEITLPGINDSIFEITFAIEDGGDYYQVDPDEANGKSRTEMIEYLTKRVEVPAFNYVVVGIRAGSFYEEKLIGRDFSTEELNIMIDAIVEGLIRTPKVYGLLGPVLEEEGKKRKEKYNIIRLEEQKREKAEERIVAEFSKRLKPILENAGWNGEWNVYKEFLQYVLVLQLTKTDAVCYKSPTQDDIISRIPTLVSFIENYNILNSADGHLSVSKYWYNIIT